MNDPNKALWRAENLLFGLIPEATCGYGQQAREKAASADLPLDGRKVSRISDFWCFVTVVLIHLGRREGGNLSGRSAREK